MTDDEILVAAEADEMIEPDVALVVAPPAYQSAATDEVIEAESPPIDSVPMASVASLAEGLNRKLDDLKTAFDREVRAEATREKVVDRLHAELQEYKQGLILSILRPVFIDLIQLHDDIGKMAVSRPDADVEPSGEVVRLLDLMRGYQQGIEDILYRQGVEPFVVEGDAFDPRRQRALSTLATDDPDRNKRVASRLRKGFQAGDKVIRPEMVVVYSYKLS